MFFRMKPNENQIIRSALQKAVRRGDINCVEKSCAFLIEHNDTDWLKKRLFVITFEECWAYGYKLNIRNDPDSIIQEYITLAGLAKNRSAASLGVLGYELSIGNLSALQNDVGDSAIRKIAEGLEDPEKFWRWVKRLTVTDKQILIVYKSQIGFTKASWPWDKAMALAAAYLAVTGKIPQIKQATTELEMPHWVAIDKHTDKGRKAIRAIAKAEGINSKLALWSSFYFESVLSNDSKSCYWWNREKEWRFNSLGLSYNEAETIWNKLRPGVQELLETESNNLKEKLSGKR